jgi:hypothetical protein
VSAAASEVIRSVEAKIRHDLPFEAQWFDVAYETCRPASASAMARWPGFGIASYARNDSVCQIDAPVVSVKKSEIFASKV